MKRETDAELVMCSLDGDKAAFGELVGRYQGLIHGLAYHRVGDFAEAQDIAQESFVKAFRRLDTLGCPEHFGRWLRAIAANECRMLIRARKRSVSMDDLELLPSHASMAAEQWRGDQSRAEVRRALEMLPDRSRLVVSLHYLSGRSHEEIAGFLGVSANAVAQHLHRARLQLREMLMAEVEEDYTMNKLPESFAEEVLGRVTLYPIVEGVVMTAEGESNTGGMTMAVTCPGKEKSYITFWATRDDLGEIILGPLGARTGENPKGRALDSCLEILRDLHIELKQVVLRLAEGRKCRADAELVQRKRKLTVNLRASDAMALAARCGVPILAEQALIRRANVGEGDVSIPDADMDPDLHNEEYRKIRECDVILDRVFAMVSTEDWMDTVRFHRDETAGELRAWLEADPTRTETFGLEEFGHGAEYVFDHARRHGSSGRLCGGDPVRGFNKVYTFLFSLLGDDARMRVVKEEDKQSESGATAKK